MGVDHKFSMLKLPDQPWLVCCSCGWQKNAANRPLKESIEKWQQHARKKGAPEERAAFSVGE